MYPEICDGIQVSIFPSSHLRTITNIGKGTLACETNIGYGTLVCETKNIELLFKPFFL